MRRKSEEIKNDIIKFIDAYFFENSVCPAMEEIAARIGVDKSTVSRYLRDMRNEGLVESSGGHRGLTTERIRETLSETKRIPLVGEIACGELSFAEQNIESYLTVSAAFLGEGEFFALRTRGDSMIDAGISAGDVVIVRVQNYADDGQIVVARAGDETTLKRYFVDRRRRMIRLHPENDGMEDMYFPSVDIQGVVKKVVKDV